jgi:ABC-2 type transport system permease protein
MSKRTVYILIGVLLLVNILGFFLYFRWDLTEDKRYSISEATKNMLSDLDTPVEVTVYLEGNSLPGGFERLRRAVKETLNEFKYYGGRNVTFTFVNPEEGSDETKKLRYQTFQKMGIVPTTVFDQKGGRKSEIAIFPYAVIKSGQKEDAILLLKSNQITSVTPEEKLNQSYENVEYELASSIQKLTNTDKKNIGFLPDFTSSSPLEFRGMIDAVKDRYNFYLIDTKASQNFDGLDALIVPSPDKPIDDSTKFKIDQFVMKGGRVLFFVDGLKVDSVGLEGSYAQPLDVKLDDLLYTYGVRINKNMVKDGLNAAVIPIVVGNAGNEPNIQEMVYRYFPLINNFGPSLITRNIGMVLTKYTATIDTVNAGDGLKKTPLLLTSPHTKILNAPALVTFNEARTDTEESEYNSGVKAVGYLVEGKFKSLYRSNFSGQDILKESEPTKILVVSDGNIIRNETNPQKGTFYPLGFDKYFKYQYGNEDFLLNALAYLVDQDGVLLSKSKTISLRPLDALKIRNDRAQIQFINIVLPLLLLLGFGVGRYFWLRKKYA